jgi:hypothetical protein
MSKVQCLHCEVVSDADRTAGYCEACGSRLPRTIRAAVRAELREAEAAYLTRTEPLPEPPDTPSLFQRARALVGRLGRACRGLFAPRPAASPAIRPGRPARRPLTGAGTR